MNNGSKPNPKFLNTDHNSSLVLSQNRSHQLPPRHSMSPRHHNLISSLSNQSTTNLERRTMTALVANSVSQL